MSFAFDEKNEKHFQELLKCYPKKEALTLPCLWMVQYQEGWISLEAMKYVAKKLDHSPMEIYSIASFYTMFNLKPIGKYHIQLCKTLSCMLNGSEELLEHLEKKFDIKNGETTKDNRFTITQVECLGNCGGAACMSLNEDYHSNLTPTKLDKILDGLPK